MASPKKRGRKVIFEEEKELYGDADHNSEGEVKDDGEEAKVVPYLSTNLLHQRNITLADVEIISYTPGDITKRETDLRVQQESIPGLVYFVDPRAEVKEAKKNAAI